MFGSIAQATKNLAIFSFCLLLLGCAPEHPTSEVGAKISTHSQALHRGFRKTFKRRQKTRVFAHAFSGVKDLPHGVAGDKYFVFVTLALKGRIIVLNRLTGKVICDLPAPKGGFLLPFGLRVPRPGRLVVLDSGGFPGPNNLVIPSVLTYKYKWDWRTRSFKAKLIRTTRFDNIPFGFAEDLEVTANGHYIISDSVLGALWVIKPDGSIHAGIKGASLAPRDAIPQLSGCLFPTNVTIDGIPFTLPGNFAPGVGAMASYKGKLYFGSSCHGGIHTVPLKSLLDNRKPHERAADIKVLAKRAPGASAESTKGLTFNRWNPRDEYLYATDPIHLRIMRYNIKTGKRENLKKDKKLFNFPVAAQFLPPISRYAPWSTMIVISDQEHRFGGLNSSLQDSIFQIPFIVTKVVLFP